MGGRLTIALTVLVVGIAACGGDGEEGASTPTEVESPVEIVVHYDRLPDGEVLPESQIGDSPFCPAGTTHDEHGEGAGEGLVVSTFHCPDGELTITFSPTQQSLKQSSPWRVLDGTGSFEGLQGEGQMESDFEKSGGPGMARFTGTIGP
jgi:hypothetical protein